MIVLSEVRRTYRKGTEEVHALNGVSLEIRRGEFVAVMGPSGSGKSTLMNVIGLLDRPDTGEYLLNGKNASALTPDEQATLRNENIGFVFQAFHLLPQTTALENVELPLVYSSRSHTRGLGMTALERVGLADRATHFPGELSGGQQQRVAIARALVQEPDLILADEPTGNLDSGTSSEIMELLRSLNAAGTTLVVITHDPNVSRHADRIVTLIDGGITSDTKRASSSSAVPSAAGTTLELK